MLKYLLLLTVALQCATGKFRFDNYTLYKVFPENLNQIKFLKHLQNTDFRYDFWNEPSPFRDFANILSSPEYKKDLEELLNRNAIQFEIVMSNIQEAIDKEKSIEYTRGNIRNMTFNGYYSNDQINNWMDDLATTYPDVVTILTIGTSYEGRPLRGIKVSHEGDEKRAIFLEGGIHAREWISPATVCYITNELLTSKDEMTKEAAREFDWYIFPVTNPDGYIWTHEEFRMWRKNRRPFGNNFGVDLNRNWNNNWLVVGASANPASDTYAGPSPFSEPETRHLSNFISSIGDRIDIYLTFHSYGQMLLIPFGNTTEPLANYYDARNVGRRAMGALSVRHGTVYVTGNSAEVIYEASGAADDWVKERIKVPLVYCYELRDTGTFGFLLPEDQIRDTGEETMDSVLELIHQGKRFGVIRTSAAAGLRVSALIIVMLAARLLFFRNFLEIR